MSEKTPLEETFNLPSIDEVTKHFENIRSDKSEDHFDEMDEYNYDDSDEEDSGSDEEEKEIDPKVLVKQIQTLTEKLNNTSSIDDHTFKTRFENDMNNVYGEAMDSFKTIINAALAMEATAGAKFLGGAAKILEIASNSKNNIMSQMIELEKLNIKRNEVYNKKPPVSYNPKDISNDSGEPNNTDDDVEEGVVYSRNQLIEQYRSEGSDNE